MLYVVEGETLEHPVLGMTTLVRYPSVCLSWRDARMELGDLGVCANGGFVFRADMSRDLGLIVEVDARGGAGFKALLDTGAQYTHCSHRFVAANDGRAFRLGDQMPVFSCNAVYNPPRTRWSARPVDIIIGMDNLTKFDAIGWRLAPLELHFVPATFAPLGEGRG